MAASIQVMMAARFFAMTTGPRAQPLMHWASGTQIPGRPWRPQTPQRPLKPQRDRLEPHVINPSWPDAPGRNPKFTSGQPAKACSLAKSQWHSQRYQHTAAEGNPAHGRHHLFSADLKTVEDIDETDTLHFTSKLAERTLRTGHGVPRSDKASPKRPIVLDCS